jgi:phage terminase large subunit GpA-like protein
MRVETTTPFDFSNPYWKGFVEGLKPDPIFTLDKWADNYRFLSQRAAAEPGRWRTSRTPYLREIMRELSSDSPTQHIVFMKGAQIGGSECGLNWIGYVIDHSPGPMLAVQPTVDLARRFSKQRIEPLIEESERLRSKIRPAKERDSGNTMFSKEFPGGILLITGANSAVGLRSMPARFLFLDEVDAYPQNVDEEGNPIALAEARTRTYKRNRKILEVSTPTIQGRSNIENSYEKSDKRRFHLPCPYCQFMQPLEFKQLKWEPNDPATTYYECIDCQGKIEERYKPQMLARGEWVAEFPEIAKLNKVAGFHLSSLYSPLGWYSWSDIVKDWLKSQGKPDQLRTFVNTVLGETWVEKGDAPDWRRLYERREPYEIRTVPEKVCFLTGGIDVQKDRLEAHIVGWGPGREAWPCDYRVFPGDTSDLSANGPWESVRKLLQETWQRADGINLSLRMVAVDSGYNTQIVYDFVRGYPANRVIATKGEDGLQMLVSAPTSVDVLSNGKRYRRGLKLWKIGASVAKSELYGLLKMDKPTDTELELGGYPPGFIHFPQFDEEYFKQLTAEQLIRKVIKGFTRYDWVKVYERNEVLDTLILCRVAAALVGADRFTAEQWDQMRGVTPVIETKLNQNAGQIASNQTQSQMSVPRGTIPRKKSTFW